MVERFVQANPEPLHQHALGLVLAALRRGRPGGRGAGGDHRAPRRRPPERAAPAPGYSIFTAEVASTVNESLLINYLLDTEKDDENKKMLIAMYLEEFRITVFRQTMFAEFEKIVHERAEQGEELTPTKLCDIYKQLNINYYGDIAKDNEYIQYEWARIPHFYNSFYVYKYATGWFLSAVFLLSFTS